MRRVLFYSTSVFTITLFTIFFGACEDENNHPILKAFVSTISLEATETTHTFTLEANVGWVISSDSKWCMVSPEYGSGSKEITVRLNSINDDVVNSRIAVLTIKSGQVKSQTIEVIQEAAEDDNEDKNEDLNIQTHTFDPVNTELNDKFGVWIYFSFENGEVGLALANTGEEEKWKNRDDWDIAFTRFYARTNSGKSGNGSGGAIEIEESNNDKENVFKNLSEAPTSGYITDGIVTNMMIGMNMPAGPVYYTSGASATINKWIDMSGGMSSMVSIPKVFVIKTANGKYAKIYLKKYDSGIITMDYVYQPDGSTRLEIAE